jgi:hypothetical protein
VKIGSAIQNRRWDGSISSTTYKIAGNTTKTVRRNGDATTTHNLGNGSSFVTNYKNLPKPKFIGNSSNSVVRKPKVKSPKISKSDNTDRPLRYNRGSSPSGNIDFGSILSFLTAVSSSNSNHNQNEVIVEDEVTAYRKKIIGYILAAILTFGVLSMFFQ